MIEKKFFGRITLEINYIFIIIELPPSRLSQIEENWYSNKFWKFMEKKNSTNAQASTIYLQDRL